MKKSLLLSLMLLASVLLSLAQSPAVFTHPGVLSSKAELDFLRSTVAADNGSPLVAGYNVLAGDSKANLSYNPTPYANVIVRGSGIVDPERYFRQDAHAAYAHAIRWAATGNVQYRNKAIQILDAWANTFRTITPEAGTGANQPTLEASWALPIWVAAAEIIKTYDPSLSWSGAGTFNTFVNRVLGYVNGQIASAPNWYISKYLALMSAGVFLDNQAMYNTGYTGVRGQIDAINVDNGKVPEFDRDFVHSQYVVIGLTQCAEIAHQQGDNALFTRTNGASQPRLSIASEFYVKTLMGAASPNRQSESSWARKSAPYEILLSRYTQLGVSVPQVRTYVLNQNRVEDAVEDHFVGWLTATHSELPPTTPPACEPVSASANDGNVPANVLDNDLNTRWSADGNGQWIQFCMGASASVKGVQIAFYSGNVRTSTFDVQVSADGISGWVNAATGLVSSGTSLDLQAFSFTPVTAKGVRIIGRGNSVNTWNSYTEVKIDTEAVSIPYGRVISLKGNNGQYVSSKGGVNPMQCNATVVQGWNQFLVSDAGNGKVTLQNTNLFVSSEDGVQAMTCNRATADAWEQFEWITHTDGTISLKGNNGMYVSSENGAVPMTCNRPTVSGWETFSYGVVGSTLMAAAAPQAVAAVAASDFKVVGYLPTWAGNVSDIQFDKLTHVNYAFLIPTSTGGYQAIENPSKLQSLVTAAHAQGVKVIVSVGGGGGGNGFKSIVPNAGYRTAFVNSMISFVNQYNLDGVDVDWEYPANGVEASNFLLLMTELSNAMHTRGKIATIAVIGLYGDSFLNGLFNVCDYVSIMAYDDNEFQHSTYDLAVRCMNYWRGRGLPASKAILGVPFYGRASGSRYEGYNTLLSWGASPNADVWGEYGYNGVPTMKAKTNLAFDQGGGIMMWELSQDVRDSRSLVSAIHDVVLSRGGGGNGCVPVSASADDGNIPANVLDGNLATRWSADGNGQWIQFCLGSTASVTGVQIAFYSGNTRTSTFDVQVSADGSGWTNAATGLVSSGTSLDLQTFTFASPKVGQYVRIVGHGNSASTWNSYTEVKINTGVISAPIGQTIWLKGNNAQYVSSNGNVEPMVCNATVAQGWNQFLVVDAGGGKVALQNQGMYVSSGNGTQPMNCNRPAVQDWEKFDWIVNTDGTISLRGNNGMYVSSENGAQPMNCNRPTIQGWEVFNYGIVSAAAKVAEAETLKSYPNPVIDRLTYTVPDGTTAHNVVVRDFTGNSVLTQSVGQVAGENTLDTSNWAKGTYYIKVFNGNFSRTFTIVKE